MSEGNPEKGEAIVTRERVVEALKADPTDLSTYVQYRDQQENAFIHSDRPAQDAIAYEIDCGDILCEAGLYQAARELYEDVANWADVPFPELAEQCRTKLAKLPRTS